MHLRTVPIIYSRGSRKVLSEILEWFDGLENRVEELANSESTIDTVYAAAQKLPAEMGVSIILGVPLGLIGYVGVLLFGFDFQMERVITAAIGAVTLGTLCMFGALRD